MNQEQIKCDRCYRLKDINLFYGINGKITKKCTECRIFKKNEKLKYNCVHGVYKYKCKQCVGSSLCNHQKQINFCKICRDEKTITIRTMIFNTKTSDIKYNRYDANTHIDKCFIDQLMDESMNCFHCNITMQLINYDDTLCTIERLNNNIGHSKANCVLCCMKCNKKLISGPGIGHIIPVEI